MQFFQAHQSACMARTSGDLFCGQGFEGPVGIFQELRKKVLFPVVAVPGKCYQLLYRVDILPFGPLRVDLDPAGEGPVQKGGKRVRNAFERDPQRVTKL